MLHYSNRRGSSSNISCCASDLHRLAPAAKGLNSTVLTNIAISDERSLSVTGISPTAITCPSPSLECLILALRRAVHRAHHHNHACMVPQNRTVKSRPSSSTPAIALYNFQHQARAPTCQSSERLVTLDSFWPCTIPLLQER